MRRALVGLLLLLPVLPVLVGAQVLTAGPAAAHAELVSSTPANGSRLDQAPSEVVLRFTERVTLVDDGLRLIGADGEPVGTGDPVVEGSTVRWALPADLPDGGYLVSWRVVSGDSHPVAGAFSFGVGAGAEPPPVPAVGTATDAPWPVAAARLGGYVGFVLVAGVLALAVLCWPGGRDHPRLRLLLRAGLVLTGLSAAAGMLLQGPYVAGLPLTQAFDRDLVSQVSSSSFGAWTQLRVFLVVAVAALLWPAGGLGERHYRLLGVLGVLALAVTFTGTSHAATGGLAERAVDAAHVLLAGAWVGGIVALAAASGRSAGPDSTAVGRFSRLATAAVVGLVATGVASSFVRLPSVAALRDDEYGRLLSLKLLLVAALLGAAAFSRRRAKRDGGLGRALRVELALAVLVLGSTAVLASTAPPPAGTEAGADTAAAAEEPATVVLDLGQGRTARLTVDPAPTTTAPSDLRLTLEDADGRPLDPVTLRVQAELPAQDVGRLSLPLGRNGDVWAGQSRFPLPGTWRLVLTVEERSGTAVVTAGELEVS